MMLEGRVLTRTESAGVLKAASGRFVVFRFCSDETGADLYLAVSGEAALFAVVLAECLTEASARAAFALLTGS